MGNRLGRWNCYTTILLHLIVIIPPLVPMRTHSYNSVVTCNYPFSCTVNNPCGKAYNPRYVAIVHGRDIPSDGDGVLSVVNNADGSTTINVCEGTQTIITLRDNSTWNCQSPVIGPPNNSTRNIEWQYGQDPTGAITNTITGAVNIAALAAHLLPAAEFHQLLMELLRSAMPSQYRPHAWQVSISGFTLNTGTRSVTGPTRNMFPHPLTLMLLRPPPHLLRPAGQSASEM